MFNTRWDLYITKHVANLYKKKKSEDNPVPDGVQLQTFVLIEGSLLKKKEPNSKTSQKN